MRECEYVRVKEAQVDNIVIRFGISRMCAGIIEDGAQPHVDKREKGDYERSRRRTFFFFLTPAYTRIGTCRLDIIPPAPARLKQRAANVARPENTFAKDRKGKGVNNGTPSDAHILIFHVGRH